MRIWQNGFTFGLGAFKDLFGDVVNQSLQPQYTPHHLVIVQNRSDGPLYLGSEEQVGASPGIVENGYVLEPGKEFRLEMSHDRLWARNDEVQVLSDIRVTIVVL